MKRFLRRFIFLIAIVGLGLFALSMTASQPDNLGLHNGKLAECPESPNCVSSQTNVSGNLMQPLSFTQSATAATEKLKKIVAENFPRARLIEHKNGYLRYEFTSLIFRFVDDVEFLVDDNTKQIHFRSASRIGHSDLGANRKRLTKISEEFTR